MRTLFPGVLGVACCALALNSWAQSPGQRLAVDTEQQSKVAVPAEVRGQAATQDVLASAGLPDSPGTTLSQQASAQSQTIPPPPSDAQAQSQQHRPVGTAAAEAPKVSGITAAEPAGVAIAPAKQRRMRTLILKVGAIVGAGAALGAVIALTEATPSKPPGAH
ncbi:MAG: hypothetical protein WA477_06110 [Candidatus Sulfotelmatobacter sp.]